MPDLSASIDLYCERTDPSLLAEPLNAASNLAFVAAGLLLLWLGRRSAEPPLVRWLLPALVCAVGVGSLLFHLYGTVWGAILDSGLILVFATVFLFAFARRIGGAGRGLAAVLSALLIVTALLATALPDLGLNGSEAYAPMLLGLVAMTVYAARARPPVGGAMLVATMLFVASLTFRTMDATVCASFPAGTHFLWHLINSLLLFRLVRVLRARPA